MNEDEYGRDLDYYNSNDMDVASDIYAENLRAKMIAIGVEAIVIDVDGGGDSGCIEIVQIKLADDDATREVSNKLSIPDLCKMTAALVEDPYRKGEVSALDVHSVCEIIIGDHLGHGWGDGNGMSGSYVFIAKPDVSGLLFSNEVADNEEYVEDDYQDDNYEDEENTTQDHSSLNSGNALTFDISGFGND